MQTGLSLVEKLNNPKIVNSYKLRLLLLMGLVSLSVEGAGAESTRVIYDEALELSKKESDSKLKFTTLWNCWRISVNDGFPRAIIWADELLNLANATKDDEQLLQAHHCQWGTLYNLGQQKECCYHTEKGISLYDPIRHANHASIYGGHDPRVCAFGQSALSFWLRGYPEKADSNLRQAQQLANELNHLGTHLHQIDISLMYYRFIKNTDQLKNQINQLQALTNKQTLSDYSAKVKIFMGWAQAIDSDPQAGLKTLLEGQSLHFSTGTWEDKPVYLEMSAQIKQILGEYQSALDDIELALINSKQSGLCYWDAELYRRKGLLNLALNSNIEQVETCFQSAIEIATKQNAKRLQLRAIVELAKVYIDFSQIEKARGIFMPVSTWLAKQKHDEVFIRAKELIDRLN